AGGNVLVGVVLLVVHRVLARGRHGSRTSAVRTTAARAARTTAACGTGILVLRLPEGVGGGRRCAVVHGDLRRPIRTLRTLSGDLEVPVLDVDLAVGTGTIDPLVRLTPGPPGAEVVVPGFPLTGLAVPEVELVLLRLTGPVVDRDLHLAVFVRFRHLERAVTLLHGQGVPIAAEVLDGLAGFGVDRIRLTRFRVDLQVLPGDGVLGLARTRKIRLRNGRWRARARRGASAATGGGPLPGVRIPGVRSLQAEIAALGELAGVPLEVLVEFPPRLVDLLLRVVTDPREVLVEVVVEIGVPGGLHPLLALVHRHHFVLFLQTTVVGADRRLDVASRLGVDPGSDLQDLLLVLHLAARERHDLPRDVRHGGTHGGRVQVVDLLDLALAHLVHRLHRGLDDVGATLQVLQQLIRVRRDVLAVFLVRGVRGGTGPVLVEGV